MNLYLPHDIWNHIFEKLDKRDLKELSLVSKYFWAITNHSKTSLKIRDRTLRSLPGILRRFQHLKDITISAKSDYVVILRQISYSDIHSQGRKRLRTLSFGKYCSLADNDFTAIVDLFPWLEGLSIPCPAHEFEYLHLKLLDLKKITFREHSTKKRKKTYPLRSARKSVFPLSLNWANIEEINMSQFYLKISEETIGFITRHCPKLTSFIFSFGMSAKHTLSLVPYYMWKDDKCSMVEAKPHPLKKLKINGPTWLGPRPDLMMLVQAFPSIREFHYRFRTRFSDIYLEEISQHLPRLTHIYFHDGKDLSIASVFALIKNCPFLKEMRLRRSITEAGEVSLINLQKHENLRWLDMSSNRYMDDKTLAEILWLCPNLQYINLSYCDQITREGVQQILETRVSLPKLEIRAFESPE